MSDLKLLRDIRLLELEVALGYFPPSNGRKVRVLELGAGAGWQARHLESLGYHVTAIDIEQSAYRQARVFPVQMYDGRSLPFPSGAFDVIFSSNVLEHIVDLDDILREMARVLTKGGIAVHILPTPVWRAWSTLLHPLWILRRSAKIGLTSTSATTRERGTGQHPHDMRAMAARFAANLLPRRHGERGNVWNEAYYFSRAFWLGQFRKCGFLVTRIESTGIFYTEHGVLNTHIPVQTRRKLSRILGSACDVYCLINP